MPDKLSLGNPKPKRAFTFTLSPPAIVGGSVMLCAGFVLVFALGILLGRGHNLEKRIPELERIMPERAATTPPFVIAEGDGQRDKPANGSSQSGDAKTEDSASNTGVMGQGDLGYREYLKTPATSAQNPRSAPAAEPARPTPRQEPPPAAKPQAPPKKPEPAKAAPPNPGTPKNESPKPPARQPGAAPDLRPLQLASPPDNPARPVQSAGAGAAQVYRYVYQAAAYKDAPSCDAFVARLKAAGFQARTEKSQDEPVWYRTMIDFTGRPDDTNALRDRLKDYGVSRVMLKSKVPVN